MDRIFCWGDTKPIDDPDLYPEEPMGRAISRQNILDVLTTLAKKKGLKPEPTMIAEITEAIMGKVKELDPCYGKANPHEPIFVLRARDLTAPNLVRRWISDVTDAYVDTKQPMTDKLTEKLAEADNIADAMAAWQGEHGGKLPD